jgi:hypothetical protein
MSTIGKQELFDHLSAFLKRKGVMLEDGPYTRRIQKGCGIIADTANKSQSALANARNKLDRGLDKVRQVIHEKTAPKAPLTAPRAEAPKPAPARKPKAGRKPSTQRRAGRSTRPPG